MNDQVDNKLWNDFLTYGRRTKARIVWRKCIKAGKFDLADKISKKYDLLGRVDDAVLAFGMALMQIKN